MICPECGHEALVTKTIRYPRGTMTLILDCQKCVRLVLATSAGAEPARLPITSP